MTILRIIYDWPDENVITEGLAPAPYELSMAQAKLGHKIYVVCGNLNGKNLKRLNFSYSIENSKISIYNLPRAITGIGPFFTTSPFALLFYLYFRFTKKIDIIHNHGHMGLCILIYKLIFGFLDKTPIVAHFHIIARGRQKSAQESGQKLSFLTKYVEYPLHHLSDLLNKKTAQAYVFVGSALMEEAKKHLNIETSKAYLVESGVNIRKFTPNGEKAELDFPQDSKILMNIGRLSKRKNIDVLVESTRYLSEEFKLVLIGEWDKELKNKVEKIIEKNNLHQRVRYLGKIPYGKIDEYFRASDIFILPSFYEGLPKVVLEALYAGNKVIASGFSIEHKIPNLFFLKEINSKHISNTVQVVDKLPSNYKETKQIIDQHYGWDTKAREIERIYQFVLR